MGLTRIIGQIDELLLDQREEEASDRTAITGYSLAAAAGNRDGTPTRATPTKKEGDRL
jgi:hypothetical protein